MAKLTDILQDMIDEAERLDKPVVRKLGNGLMIGIKADTTNYTITLARDDTYPSAKEWETVFRHFPYYCTMPDAKQTVTRHGRKALTGRVAKRHIQQMRFN
jgi:hypothetical protein